jgi:hypothetical protein
LVLRPRLDGLRVAVDDPDIGAHADRDVRRVRADHAGAENDHLGRIDSRHAAEQHAETAVRMLQAIGARLDRHAPGNLRHRRQQRQAAMRRSYGLVGDAGGAAGNQVFGLLRVRRQVQVGKQHLPLAQHRAFSRLRLLDLHHQLRAREDFIG